MKNAFLYIVISLFSTICGFSQSKDTLLNMVLSKPFFYNVIQGKDGKIYVGTSKGIFQVEGTFLTHYNSEIGYITNNEAGLPIVEHSGIRYYKEKKYLHLLPYPEMTREEYHAIKDDLLYICSGGRMYIFDILSYGYSYENHSFRTISKNLLGTYSGIYLNGKKMDRPISSFVDGYIRQFDDRAFICNNEIKVLEKEALQTGILDSGSTYLEYSLPEKTMYNDIYPSPDKQSYYVASQQKLIQVNRSFTSDTVLFAFQDKDAPIGLATENEYFLYFFANKKLFALDYSNNAIKELLTIDETILAGLYADQQVYLVTANALYRYNSGQKLEKIISLRQAHSILKLSGSELLIASDNGLYLVNLANRNISSVIEGVEFNRRALHKEGDMIFAGSINGLYTINILDVPALIEKNSVVQEMSVQSSNRILALLFVSALFSITGILFFRFRKKLKKANELIESLQTPKESVTREVIEEFILHNLPSASIKTLTDKFNLNAPQVYAILNPDKPGSIIQKLRLQTLKKMKENGKPIEEIASATGLSISYLKRLKS